MCGITGYLDRLPQVSDHSASLTRAVHALRHRGPNHSATWKSDPMVGLGHTRLAIVDISEHGNQPMVSSDGRLVMAFNGEVYNFSSIRAELEPLGHKFRGTGDSEVILAAFSQWGVEPALHRFIGMFAIALWDRDDRKLWLLRDRLGVKPLYYGWINNLFWFGSELKALLAFALERPVLDKNALAEYFQFGYINAPRSIYHNVFKLSPGYLLELGMTGQPVVRSYWSVLDALVSPLVGAECQLAEQLEELMADAFALRMVADVPVGVFLSGGIDSSAVAAVLQKMSPKPIHTFTIGFKEPQYDESAHARRVAAHLGTHHTERILSIRDAMGILQMWGQLYDEPFFDSSGIPTYLVSKIASEEVKVVLSADGGDELFSGYAAYDCMLQRTIKKERMATLLRKALQVALPRMPLQQVDEMLDASPLPTSLRQWLRNRSTWRAVQACDALCSPTSGMGYERMFTIWDAAEISVLTGNYTRLRNTSDAYPGQFAEQMCLWDLHNYLPGDILAKVDRASMAVSIESREPLLDHRLVEFAFRLPLSLRRGTLGSKHLLRKVLYQYVPRPLVDRPKMGFGIPLGQWLRNDMRCLIDRYLDPAAVKQGGILDPSTVAITVRAFLRGNDHALNRVWTLLAFQMWNEQSSLIQPSRMFREEDVSVN